MATVSRKVKDPQSLQIDNQPPAIAFAPTLSPVIHDAYERLFDAAHELGVNYSNEWAYGEEAAEVLPELLDAAIELARLIGFEPSKGGAA